jgi:hypothetical protein
MDAAIKVDKPLLFRQSLGLKSRFLLNALIL